MSFNALKVIALLTSMTSKQQPVHFRMFILSAQHHQQQQHHPQQQQLPQQLQPQPQRQLQQPQQLPQPQQPQQQ